MSDELQGSAETAGGPERIMPGDSRPAHHCSQLRVSADDDPRQRRSRAAGPVEGRDEWLLSQDRLTLPAFSPYAMGRGRTELRVHFDWGSDFGWDQDLAGEVPHDRRYLVDGEHRTLEVDLRRGIGDRLAVGLRVPLRWRGGGILDPIIDAFHRVVTDPLGLPDNGRPEFLRNRLRALGRDGQGRPVEWTARGGTGVGSLELSAARTLHTRPEGWTGALALRLVLPTGTGPFASSGLAAGVQYAAARPLGRRVDVYLGAGAAAFTDRESHGIRYEPARVHVFSALEWRPARRWSLLVQADGSSRLVANLARYPGVQSYLRIGAKVALSERLRLEGGFVENMVNQDATTDFGIFLGLTTRF
jgi:hypothetical protein